MTGGMVRPTGRGDQYRNNIDDVAGKLTESLAMCDDIVFAILFGSYTGGGRTDMSDLDLALFFKSKTDFYRINALREDLTQKLGTEVDIVVLNNAMPVVRMQVLKKGRLLLNRDTRAYNDFFVNTVKEYDDLKRNRKEVEEKILRGRIYA